MDSQVSKPRLVPLADTDDGIRAVELTRVFNTGWGRRRHTRVALDRVSFSVEPGEAVGLLGPNGAGKTTCVRILTGLLAPSAGTAIVCGFDATRDPDRLHACVGVSFGGDSGLYTRLSGLDNLRYFASMYGSAGRAADRLSYRLLDRVGLAERAADRVETYSRGMRQRLHIARALLHDPRVLLLDEPSSGLDPDHARQLRELVSTLSAEGRAILLTTHDMLEAEQVCQRVVILREGRVVRGTGVRELREDAARALGHRVELRTASAPPPGVLAGVPGILRQVAEESDPATLVLYTREPAAATGYLLDQLGDQVLSVSVAPPSLEDAYLAALG
jgi:ABC-2 type transport system ATP-binding protein